MALGGFLSTYCRYEGKTQTLTRTPARWHTPAYVHAHRHMAFEHAHTHADARTHAQVYTHTRTQTRRGGPRHAYMSLVMGQTLRDFQKRERERARDILRVLPHIQ